MSQPQVTPSFMHKPHDASAPQDWQQHISQQQMQNSYVYTHWFKSVILEAVRAGLDPQTSLMQSLAPILDSVSKNAKTGVDNLENHRKIINQGFQNVQHEQNDVKRGLEVLGYANQEWHKGHKRLLEEQTARIDHIQTQLQNLQGDIQKLTTFADVKPQTLVNNRLGHMEEQVAKIAMRLLPVETKSRMSTRAQRNRKLDGLQRQAPLIQETVEALHGAMEDFRLSSNEDAVGASCRLLKGQKGKVLKRKGKRKT